MSRSVSNNHLLMFVHTTTPIMNTKSNPCRFHSHSNVHTPIHTHKLSASIIANSNTQLPKYVQHRSCTLFALLHRTCWENKGESAEILTVLCCDNKYGTYTLERSTCNSVYLSARNFAVVFLSFEVCFALRPPPRNVCKPFVP